MSLQLFRPAGRAAPLLAVGYEAGHVALWDTSSTSAPLAVTRLHEEPVLSLFVDAHGSGAMHCHRMHRNVAEKNVAEPLTHGAHVPVVGQGQSR